MYTYNLSKEEQDYLKEYDVQNIVNLHKRQKNYLILDSINVKNKYHNQVTTNLITKKIKQIIVKNLNESYKIETIF